MDGLREFGPGTQSRVGADPTSAGDHGTVDVAHRLHLDSVPENRVANDASRADLDAFAEGHVALEYDVDVDDAVPARLQAAADVEPGRVHDGDTVPHEFVGQATLVVALELCQLRAVVDAHDLLGDAAIDARDRDPVEFGFADNVGQVVLALLVVAVEGPKQCIEDRPWCRENAGIDLGDRPLLRRRIGVFDNADDAPVAAQDAPEAAWIGQVDGDQGDALARCGDTLRERLRTHQGDVAEQHEHGRVVVDFRQGLCHSMAAAEAWLLENPGNP